MKSLFPEIEQEILDDRKAARREEKQRAREYLRGRDVSWLINRLLEKGPQTEASLMWERMEEEFHFEDAAKHSSEVFSDLWALWKVGKLWRSYVGFHPGAGEKSYQFGIRKVHQYPTPTRARA
jgi:hypothetical protein